MTGDACIAVVESMEGDEWGPTERNQDCAWSDADVMYANVA